MKDKSWLDRLIEERDKHSAKLGKLHEFIFRTPAFYELNEARQTLLRQQYYAMDQYRTIMDMRIAYEVAHD